MARGTPVRPSLVEAARKSRLDGLTALRDSLAAAIQADSEGNQTAALARQLRDVLADIDEIERKAGRKGSIVDELAGRRQARSANTSGKPPARQRKAKPRG